MVLLFASLACAPEAAEAELGFVANACGPVAAFQADRKWAWASTDEAETLVDWTSEVRSLKGNSARIWTVGSTAGPQFTEDYSRTSEYECGGGAWLLREETQAAGLEAGVSYTRSTVTEYDEPVLIWPDELANGVRWQSHWVGTSTSDGVKSAVDRTVDYAVKAPSVIEVEGGQFQAFLVIATDQDGTDSRFWLAREAGLIKGPDYELTGLW